MAGAGNGGHQAIQLGGGTLGFQVHCAVPVVFHPAGQIQQLGGILRTVAEANPLNFVLHPIDSVILMTLFVAWLLSGTARLNSFDPKPASQSEPQKEPAE